MQTIRRLALLAAAAAIGFALALPQAGFAAGPDNPTSVPPPKPPPPTDPTRKPTAKPAKKPAKKPAQQTQRDYEDGYRLAYKLIYADHDYAGGIAKLRSLHNDDNADIANLIGYSNRKLGRYEDSKRWYERALAADPRHARTWSYYGMWHAEQGNALKALDYLETVRSICGTGCREYTELKGVIEGTRTY